jgi:hypothetical protein
MGNMVRAFEGGRNKELCTTTKYLESSSWNEKNINLMSISDKSFKHVDFPPTTCYMVLFFVTF